ncbi:helix-turn-helix domain-containing protein [Chryseobacterium vrystaatense]|nr:XRE family transcriptional regulator [Chryseobacterium vrystaatense]
MSDRVREVLKKHSFKLTDLAEKLGINYAPFNKKINKPTLKTLEELSILTGISVIEFQNAPEGYSHFYDGSTGQWEGIRRK